MLIATKIVMLLVLVDAAFAVTSSGTWKLMPSMDAALVSAANRLRRWQSFILALACLLAIVALEVWA